MDTFNFVVVLLAAVQLYKSETQYVLISRFFYAILVFDILPVITVYTGFSKTVAPKNINSYCDKKNKNKKKPV